MCQDQVRNKFFFQFLKLHLNPRMKRREKAIAVVSDRYLLGLGSFEEQTRPFYRFPLPYWIRAEHLPADLPFGVFLYNRKIVPPHPISMSSQCAPRHRMRRGGLPTSPRVSFSMFVFGLGNVVPAAPPHGNHSLFVL